MTEFSRIERQALAVVEEAIARSYMIDAEDCRPDVKLALQALAKKHAHRAVALRTHGTETS